MKVLITGIHGFVGNNLVVVLKQNNTAFGIDIVQSQNKEILKTFGWDELDCIPPLDIIVHLAGKAHDTKNSTEEKAYFDINVGLTQTIFNYYLKSNAKKFIFFSSVKAAVDSVEGDPLTEEVVPNPKTPYGKSKLEAEKYILKELEKWEGENVGIQKKVYILRPCMIHGPGNKGNLNLLYKISKKGFPWPLGAFENKRSFCSIDNISFIVNEIIEKDIEAGIYNIADDEAPSTNELISLISQSQNRKERIWEIRPSAIKGIAKAGDLLHLPLNSERLKKLTESYVVSNEKIKKALGIEKMPVSALDGLRKTLDSFNR